MSVFHHSAIGDEGAVVQNKSLRFDRDSSTKAARTFSSAGDDQKFTIAGWFKWSDCEISNSSTDYVPLLYAKNSSNQVDILKWYRWGALELDFHDTGGYGPYVRTVGRYTDRTNWYHFCIQVDTAQSAFSDRFTFYVNGLDVDLTGWATAYTADHQFLALNTASEHVIGYDETRYFGGQCTDFYFVDGATVDPVGNFIEANDYKGYKPKSTAYDLSSHGDNSCHLKFDDDPSASSWTAADSSDNSNDFTVTASNALYSQSLDHPDNNFAVLNSKSRGASSAGGAEIKGGGLRMQCDSTTWSYQNGYSSTITIDKKTYFEVLLNSQTATSILGIFDPRTMGYIDSISYYTGSGGGITIPAGNKIVRCEIDPTLGANSTIKWYLEDSTSTLATETFDSSDKSYVVQAYPVTDADTSNAAAFQHFNFGSDSSFGGNKTSGSANATDSNGYGDFYYEPPSGYLAACQKNFGEPSFKSHEKFDAMAWEGNGTASTNKTGIDFTPHMSIVKNREGSYCGIIQDALRGLGNYHVTSDGGEEATSSDLVTAYITASGAGTGGITLGSGGGVNANDHRCGAYLWSASSTATGARYDTDAGFSIRTWTGDGGGDTSSDTQTINHYLGVKPELIIATGRSGDAQYADYGAYTGRIVWHKDLSAADKYMLLQEAGGEYSGSSDQLITNIGTTSVDFGNDVTNAYQGLNYSSDWGNGSDTYVAYFFASVPQHSRVGYYTGNGNEWDDTQPPPFVELDFTPRFVMVKSTTGYTSWAMYDSNRVDASVYKPERSSYNTWSWAADSCAAESSTNGELSFNSNGFTPYGSDSLTNSSGVRYIFLALAYEPLGYSNAW